MQHERNVFNRISTRKKNKDILDDKEKLFQKKREILDELISNNIKFDEPTIDTIIEEKLNSVHLKSINLQALILATIVIGETEVKKKNVFFIDNKKIKTMCNKLKKLRDSLIFNDIYCEDIIRYSRFLINLYSQ
jgi:hypothetical protein